jgi:hypothetical protein
MLRATKVVDIVRRLRKWTRSRLGLKRVLRRCITGNEWAEHISKTRHPPSLSRRCFGLGRSSKQHRRSRCILHAGGRYKCSCKRMPNLPKPCTAKRFLRWLVYRGDEVAYSNQPQARPHGRLFAVVWMFG